MTRRRRERWEVIPQELRGAFIVWSRCDWRRIEVGLAQQAGRLPKVESYRAIARRVGIDDKTAANWAGEWATWADLIGPRRCGAGRVIRILAARGKNIPENGECRSAV